METTSTSRRAQREALEREILYWLQDHHPSLCDALSPRDLLSAIHVACEEAFLFGIANETSLASWTAFYLSAREVWATLRERAWATLVDPMRSASEKLEALQAALDWEMQLDQGPGIC